MIRLSRSFRSFIEEARQNTAMISLATVMSNPSSRGTPFAFPPRPSTTNRSCRSFMSTQRFQVIFFTSIPRAFPCWMWLSSMAASRLFAAPMAWKSPVKCRLISSIGTTWAYPPPAAPPLTPNTGPRLGSRSATVTSLPMRLRPSARPMVVVVLPSPAGVGVIAVTSTSLPGFRSVSSISAGSILALYRPYCSTYFSSTWALCAISMIGFISHCCAISMSDK